MQILKLKMTKDLLAKFLVELAKEDRKVMIDTYVKNSILDTVEILLEDISKISEGQAPPRKLEPRKEDVLRQMLKGIFSLKDQTFGSGYDEAMAVKHIYRDRWAKRLHEAGRGDTALGAGEINELIVYLEEQQQTISNLRDQLDEETKEEGNEEEDDIISKIKNRVKIPDIERSYRNLTFERDTLRIALKEALSKKKSDPEYRLADLVLAHAEEMSVDYIKLAKLVLKKYVLAD